VNSCVTFTGSNYLQTSTSIDFPSLSGVSFSFWFKFNGAASDQWPRIFDFGNGQSQTNVQATRLGNGNGMQMTVYAVDSSHTYIQVMDTWISGEYINIFIYIYIYILIYEYIYIYIY
jgi:hypothetical protein